MVSNCLVCGSPVKRRTAIYCSNRCRSGSRWLKTKEQIRSSGVGLHPKTTRKYLLETHGNGCWECKITEWRGVPTPLILDHINGNAEDCRLQNLRMICPNCDALTSTYKAKNKGNGRASRRQRYREGKSY